MTLSSTDNEEGWLSEYLEAVRPLSFRCSHLINTRLFGLSPLFGLSALLSFKEIICHGVGEFAIVRNERGSTQGLPYKDMLRVPHRLHYFAQKHAPCHLVIV